MKCGTRKQEQRRKKRRQRQKGLRRASGQPHGSVAAAQPGLKACRQKRKGNSEIRNVGRKAETVLSSLTLARLACHTHTQVLLTRMPSQRDTARRGRSARSVRMDRKAGMSAAPAIMAARFTRDSCGGTKWQSDTRRQRGNAAHRAQEQGTGAHHHWPFCQEFTFSRNS